VLSGTAPKVKSKNNKNQAKEKSFLKCPSKVLNFFEKHSLAAWIVINFMAS